MSLHLIFLPQEGSLGLNFWIRSHRGSLAWEKSLGLGFCKVSCGQTVTERWQAKAFQFIAAYRTRDYQHCQRFLTGMCWIRMPFWWKMGLHFRWSMVLLLSTSEMYMPRDPPGNLRRRPPEYAPTYRAYLIPLTTGTWRRIFSGRITSMNKPWSSAIWKGSHNCILRGRNGSPWLLTTYLSVLGWSSKPLSGDGFGSSRVLHVKHPHGYPCHSEANLPFRKATQ